jgi:hypothetical protein
MQYTPFMYYQEIFYLSYPISFKHIKLSLLSKYKYFKE